MPISEYDGDGRDDNEGPHCRNCHIGANNCYVCHSNDDRTNNFGANTTAVNVSAAYTSELTTHVANMTPYASQSFIKQSAVATTAAGEPCLDGGFSFPHRTLGENMLKDELFGIDFNGDAIAAGVLRAGNAMLDPSTDALANQTTTAIEQVPVFEYWIAEDRNATSGIPAVSNDPTSALAGVAAENLDSVCIDCHGDSTYYNDGPGAWTAETYTAVADLGARGVYGSGEKGGWELLLKGLP